MKLKLQNFYYKHTEKVVKKMQKKSHWSENAVYFKNQDYFPEDDPGFKKLTVCHQQNIVWKIFVQI